MMGPRLPRRSPSRPANGRSIAAVNANAPVTKPTATPPPPSSCSKAAARQRRQQHADADEVEHHDPRERPGDETLAALLQRLPTLRPRSTSVWGRRVPGPTGSRRTSTAKLVRTSEVNTSDTDRPCHASRAGSGERQHERALRSQHAVHLPEDAIEVVDLGEGEHRHRGVDRASARTRGRRPSPGERPSRGRPRSEPAPRRVAPSSARRSRPWRPRPHEGGRHVGVEAAEHEDPLAGERAEQAQPIRAVRRVHS